ncbi:hypothetical protein NP233_g1415 [Leucocoprinus birnbaumii]|uniref:Uncharacterized protein n=1 Tax=Leucocoprinus birnbaumii TaxID=56174 RepID=A0AAD5W289_9AGAR|nr:hypothetical protein NP233_g1415 [Leucocoprinus birnbaumii]
MPHKCCRKLQLKVKIIWLNPSEGLDDINLISGTTKRIIPLQMIAFRCTNTLVLGWWRLLLLLIVPFYSIGQQTNVSVNDAGVNQNGHAIIYSPASSVTAGWRIQPGCSTCALMPDPLEMTSGTWHEGGPHQSAELIFSVTGLDTSLAFLIDNSTAFNYSFSVASLQTPSTSGFLYHVPVLAVKDLPDDTHVLKVINNGPAVMLLDEIIYTYSKAILDASKSSGIHRRVIPGGSTHDTGSVSEDSSEFGGGGSSTGSNTLSAGVIIAIVFSVLLVAALILYCIIRPCVSAASRQGEPPRNISSSANPGDTRPQVVAQRPQMREGGPVSHH